MLSYVVCLLLIVTRTLGTPAPPCTGDDCEQEVVGDEEYEAERRYNNSHAEPEDGLVVSIYNTREIWVWSRLSQNHDDWTGLNIEAGPNKVGQLWKFVDKSHVDRDWWIINTNSQNHFELHLGQSGTLDLGTENGDFNDEQQFVFKKFGKRNYAIVSAKHNAAVCLKGIKTLSNGLYLGEGTDDKFLCLKGFMGTSATQGFCRESSMVDPGNFCHPDQIGDKYDLTVEECKAKFAGTGKAFNHYVHGDGSNHCQETAVEGLVEDKGGWQVCYDVANSGGATFGDGCVWHFENPWASTAIWKTITRVLNEGSAPDIFTYTYKVGYSEESSHSSSHKQKSEISMTASGDGAIKGINLGASVTGTLSEEFGDSVTKSYKGHTEEERKHETEVKPDECLEVRQLVVDQTDMLGIDTDGGTLYSDKFRGTTQTLWLKPCFSDDIGEPIPPTKDVDTQSAGGDENTGIKEAIFMTATAASSDDVFVYGFAAVGVAFLLYGAGKHFFGKSTDRYVTIDANV